MARPQGPPGLKPARGCASIQLVIEISFFDAPRRRGTGAPRPGLQSRFLTAPKGRSTPALIIAQDFSPGWPCVSAETRRGTGAPRPGLQSRFLTAPKGRSTPALIIAQDFSPGWPVCRPKPAGAQVPQGRDFSPVS